VIINAANAHVYEEHISSAAIYTIEKNINYQSLFQLQQFQIFLTMKWQLKIIHTIQG
jgi:hypothetical protein